MVDISDFLRGRGVPEDAVLLMEEQKVSEKREILWCLLFLQENSYGTVTVSC